MHERMLDKNHQPTEAEMIRVIGKPVSKAWTALRRFLAETYQIEPTYNSGGQKYGWNLQYRAGGRPLCDKSPLLIVGEMYPEYGSFTALVILGKAELDMAMARLDEFGAVVRQALTESPRFHDGCWMYIRVTDPLTCEQDGRNIEQLILIKKKPRKKMPKA